MQNSCHIVYQCRLDFGEEKFDSKWCHFFEQETTMISPCCIFNYAGGCHCNAAHVDVLKIHLHNTEGSLASGIMGNEGLVEHEYPLHKRVVERTH